MIQYREEFEYFKDEDAMTGNAMTTDNFGGAIRYGRSLFFTKRNACLRTYPDIPRRATLFHKTNHVGISQRH